MWRISQIGLHDSHLQKFVRFELHGSFTAAPTSSSLHLLDSIQMRSNLQSTTPQDHSSSPCSLNALHGADSLMLDSSSLMAKESARRFLLQISSCYDPFGGRGQLSSFKTSGYQFLS